MKKAMLFCVSLVCLIGCATMSIAAPLDQYATSVIDVSSKFSETGPFSPAQALGAPNCVAYGDNAAAWTPVPANGTFEYITLGYLTPVYANGAVITETYGNGFVYQVDALDITDVLHTVWTGSDPSDPGFPVDFTVSWSTTPYLVKGLKIHTDTNHNLATWEEIDAVQLKGDTEAPGGTSVPEPTTMLLLGLGLIGLAGVRKRLSI
jgi:hypothetical protein